ncbi:MAG TPA: hypothetical protein PLK31_12710 [Chloroflexota bacterium]|nr:hypothetical protein [Chloroflexota bacterium]
MVQWIYPEWKLLASNITEEVIIGRDVLNYFIVTLNGLALMTDIQD